jgi:hypothetical protein
MVHVLSQKGVTRTYRTLQLHLTHNDKCTNCEDGCLEDRDHIMRCREISRAQWRADVINTLEKKCFALKTDPGLSRILIQGLHRWLHHQEPLRDDNVPQKYRKLIQQQNGLGWRQLFNGRMCKEWARIQDDYYYIANQRGHDSSRLSAGADPTTKAKGYVGQLNGTTWTTEVINVLWEQWAVVWVTRNAAVHGHDEATRSQQRDRVNRQRLEAIYEAKMEMEPRIRELLLYDTVEEHMQHSQRTIHNWLAVHEETIAQSIKHAARRAIQGMRSIRSFFHGGGHQVTPTQQNQRQRQATRTHRTVAATVQTYGTRR